MPDLAPQLVAEITALGKTVLLLVAITFILWSLYTAMVVPKKHPNFPRDLGLFIVVTAALFVAQMSAVLWVTGTQEVERRGGGGDDDRWGGDDGRRRDHGGGETTAGSAAGDPAAGKEVFASAGCGSCHTLSDARATGPSARTSTTRSRRRIWWSSA